MKINETKMKQAQEEALKILQVGEDKAEAVKNCIEGPITPAVQGSVLHLHPDVTIICDEAAYSKLK